MPVAPYQHGLLHPQSNSKKEVYIMSVSSTGWLHCLDVLRQAPQGTFDRRLGTALTGADEDGALTLLVDIIVEDPCGTHEYEIAGHMLHHLTEAEVAR